MRITLRRWAGAAAFVAAAAPLLSAQAKEGDSPEYKFAKAPWNGVGIQSLADLQGKPTLVEFWGTR